MEVSNKGIAFLKAREGFDLRCKRGDSWIAHHDTVADIYDMPYGITKHIDGRKVQKNEVWTDEYVNETFEKMVKAFEKTVNNLIPNVDDLSQSQFDSIFSFVWNIGTGNFADSTALKLIKKRMFDDVPEAMMRFNGVTSTVKQPDGTYKRVLIPIKGIINRRKFEIKLWEKGDYGSSDSAS